MSTETSPPIEDTSASAPPESVGRILVRRVTRLEIAVGVVIAAVLIVLVLVEPGILEAPFENERTLLFTFGGTALAAIAYAVMLWFRVPPVMRVVVLVVPFAIVNWWLISPYFVDDVVDEDFSTSIAEQVAPATDVPSVGSANTMPAAPEQPIETPPGATSAPTTVVPAVQEPAPTPPPAPAGPILLGAGQFVGLAGHSGTGDAGIFQNPDGSLVLRFENFDIENGPDLEVYLVPGADQVSLAAGAIHLGSLKGNIGDQNYDLPAGTALQPGSYTALVWCEAFSVEFVGATIVV